MVAEMEAARLSSTDHCANARIRRRLDRFRRVGMFSECEGLTITQASTVSELREAYRLVHDVFVQRGYIVPQPGGMRIRAFEALPDMATFVAKADGRVVAVMSMVPDTREFGLPSDKAFREELDALRADGRRVCEITNLAVDPSYRNGALFLELTRVILAHGLTMGYTDGFISISEEHAPFFLTVMGFEPCGERRNYGGDTVDYVVGLRLDGTTHEDRLIETDRMLGDDAFLHEWFYTRNVYFNCAGDWHEAARQEFLDPALLHRLLVQESKFLNRCDDSVIEGLQHCWEPGLLDQVMGPATLAHARLAA